MKRKGGKKKMRKRGPGEMSQPQATPPPSVSSGREGGLEQASGQESVEESGLKGGAGEIVGGTEGMIDGRLSVNQGMEKTGSETDPVNPCRRSY